MDSEPIVEVGLHTSVCSNLTEAQTHLCSAQFFVSPFIVRLPTAVPFYSHKHLTEQEGYLLPRQVLIHFLQLI